MAETGTTGPTPPRGGAPRWMTVLLVVSLALNLLVAGAVVGAALSGGQKWRDGPRGPGGVGALSRALDEQDRRVLKQRMAERFAAEGEVRAAFRQEMAGLIAALRAESFDHAAAVAGMARLRGVMDTRLQSAQELLVAHWAGMSAEARAAYADRLEAELRRKRR